MSSVGISRDEWLAAVREVEPVNDQDALTVNELSAMLGTKTTTTKERITKLVADGKAIATTKRITDRMGRAQWLSAYRLVKATKKGK